MYKGQSQKNEWRSIHTAPLEKALGYTTLLEMVIASTVKLSRKSLNAFIKIIHQALCAVAFMVLALTTSHGGKRQLMCPYHLCDEDVCVDDVSEPAILSHDSLRALNSRSSHDSGK